LYELKIKLIYYI